MQTEPKYWFPAKRYGWGWGIPNTWQGWLVLAVFAALHRAPQLRREIERYDSEYRRNGTANLFVSRQTSLWIKVRAHRRSRCRLIRFLT